MSRQAIVQGRDLSGNDDSGWTLSGYVIPRLASGLIGCEEVQPLDSGGQA
jgi:hypothetical protein